MEQLLQEMLQKNYGKNIQDASNRRNLYSTFILTKEKMKGAKRNEGKKKALHISPQNF